MWKSDGVEASLGLPVPSLYLLEPGPGGFEGSAAGMSIAWSVRKEEELFGESKSTFFLSETPKVKAKNLLCRLIIPYIVCHANGKA